MYNGIFQYNNSSGLWFTRAGIYGRKTYQEICNNYALTVEQDFLSMPLITVSIIAVINAQYTHDLYLSSFVIRC